MGKLNWHNTLRRERINKKGYTHKYDGLPIYQKGDRKLRGLLGYYGVRTSILGDSNDVMEYASKFFGVPLELASDCEEMFDTCQKAAAQKKYQTKKPARRGIEHAEDALRRTVMNPETDDRVVASRILGMRTEAEEMS